MAIATPPPSGERRSSEVHGDDRRTGAGQSPDGAVPSPHGSLRTRPGRHGTAAGVATPASLRALLARMRRPIHEWPLPAQYGLSLGGILVAILARWLLHPILGDGVPFLTVLTALLLLILVVRPGPFLAAAGLAWIGSFFLFIDPPFRWTVAGASEWAQVGLFSIAAATSAIAAWISRRAQDRRLAAEATLRAKEAELELVAQTTPLILTRCSRDLRYLYVNRAAADLFELAPEEIIGRPIVEVTGQETFGRILPRIERVLQGEKVEYEDELEYPSGRCWVRVQYDPERDDNGEVVSWVASVVDITARKQHEQQLRLAMAELNHRVKNTLATIEAIARQTLQSDATLEDVREIFAERLRSIAAAHSLLTKSDWTGVEIRDLLLAELRARVTSPDHLDLAGPRVIIQPGAALALHMAVHELTTNAAKYGSLSVPEGRLSVAWRLNGADSDLQLQIEWLERDGPPTKEPPRRSFGSTMIADVIGYQLDGEVVKLFEPAGLRCEITLPLAKIGRVDYTSVRRGSDDPPGENPAAPIKKVPAAKALARPLRVLVVEDNYAVARSLGQQLERAGCAVVGPAGTLDKAMELARNGSLDAALLDVDLRGAKVYPLARDLRSRNIPLVMLTGFNAEDLPEDLRAMPIFSKPLDAEKLRAWLAHLE